jgi:Mg2+-importing ATPase
MRAGGEGPRGLDISEAARTDTSAVLERLASSKTGLTAAEAARRLRVVGPNAIKSQSAQAFEVLLRQLRSPLLLLLLVAALTSLAVGERTDAIIILGILSLSIGLGFFNEYRAARAVEALHARIGHVVVTFRDGRAAEVDVAELVPGDLVRLDIGDVVPADLRLIEVNGLECDEAVLTGEATPAEKTAAAVPAGRSPLDLPSCAFMGTVVRSGTALAVVVQTGHQTAFGRIASRLGQQQAETAFQHGLKQFSGLLVQVTTVLTVSIFVINAALGRSLLDSVLFALAIAVGLTPQLLPAIVTISLATGARRLAHEAVIVKRLVSIEDLGNIDVLFTDKTGTLTEGHITFDSAYDTAGRPSPETFRFGLLCTSVVVEGGVPVGGNPLDQALWNAPRASGPETTPYTKLAEAPFDYERRLMSVLVESTNGDRLLITKGAPESVFARCREVPSEAASFLDEQFKAGKRVIAVATRDASTLVGVPPAEEQELTLHGFLTFSDRAKPDAAASIERLARLGVAVKIVTGDNEQVALHLCHEVGINVAASLDGSTIESMSDDELSAALAATSIFARVTPEQKSRIIQLQRRSGTDAGFLGDGVNDALALHDADVGISVDSASDVAKDAADIVLLEKDLGVLADGIVEGRRIFSNTIKYVLMGTSSNFGNMFSAAGASLFLSFLPMLPSQILLNNLLYDVSETTIPTDNVDEELLERPAHWDIAFIRKFMLFFGPISSLYDFLTFGVLLWVFGAGEVLFHSGWFVESLATQTLVIFIIRTRRVPFFHSRPSFPLLMTTLACVATGAAIPFSPLADLFGFARLPWGVLAAIVVMTATYLALAELGKARFFRPERGKEPLAPRRERRQRRIHRLAPRWYSRLG